MPSFSTRACSIRARVCFVAAVAIGMCVSAQAEAVSGIVYDEQSFQPLAGAELYLVDDASGARLPREALGPGQQGQRTGSGGSYQFDPPAGVYRIELIAPAGYHFPARALPLGGSASAPQGSVGTGRPGEAVSVHELPAAGEPNPYFIRLRSTGQSREMLNNHLPLTPTPALVRLAHSARLARIETGEAAAFSITIENATQRPLPDPEHGPMVLDVSLPAGFDLQESDVVVSVRPSGERVPTPPVRRIGTRDDTFAIDGLSVPPGQTYEVRYIVAAGASVRPKRYVFLAALRTQAGALAPAATAPLTVQADPLFERSELIGRVFCDSNKNGFPDRGERGVPRARIYLDNGSYSVADDHGKYHFSNIAGGYHMAKVDPDTVPPGATPTRSIRRDFHLTPGLPAKIDFGFACKLEATAVTSAEPPPPTMIEITGSEQAMAITVGSETFISNDVDVVLSQVSAEPLFESNRLVLTPRIGADGNVELPPLAFHTRVKAISPTTHFSVIVRDEAGTAMYRIDGAGPVPAVVATDLRERGKLAVEPGRSYTYELATWSRDLYARSARKTLVLRPLPQAPGGTIATLRGELFSRNDRPTPELIAKLGDVVTRLLASRAPVSIEVHVANDGPAATRLPVTEKRAQSVKTLLTSFGVAAERISAKGVGDKQPLGPNLGRKGKETNRRVVISLGEEPASLPATAPSSMPASASAPAAGRRALVHGVGVALEGEGFKTRVLPAARTSVFMEREDGRAFAIRMGELPSQGKNAVELVGGIASDSITLDGVAVPLPLASFGCSIKEGSGILGPGGTLLSPIRFVPSGKLAQLEAIRVAIYDEKDALREVVELAPGDNEMVYAGRGLTPGTYAYRCSAKDHAHGVVITAPEMFTLETARGEEIVVRGRLFERGAVGPDLKAALDALLERGGGAGPITLEVHSGAPPTANAMREQMATLVEAGIAKRYLESRGAKDVSVKGLGRNQPLVPPLGRKARDQNRRVVLRSGLVAPSAPATEPATEPSSEPLAAEAPLPDLRAPEKKSVSINGERVKVDEQGQFAHTVVREGTEHDTPIAVRVSNGQGRETLYHLTPQQASSAEALTGRMPFAGEPGPELAFEGRDEPPAEAIMASASSAPVPQNVVLDLPPDGAVIKQDHLIVVARGPAGSEVLVTCNGKEQSFPIEASGETTIEVPLTAGKNSVVFDVATDDGRLGRVERTYTMQPNRWFLLALGDMSFGQSGAQALLPEAGENDSTLKIMNGEYFLHGRVALYFKGRVKGDWFFKDNRFTAYVDSAYAEQGNFVRNVIEPDKFYPIYGDAAAEVQDARQGKVYVLIEADASKLEGGNVLTQIQGLELFRYDRALFGARLDWNRGFSKYDHTRLQAFAGQPLQSSRRVHATLRGTGGSLYFLRDRDIVEGSEQVRFVVRDAVSGTVVEEGVKRRNVDYTISYDTGRLVFLEPVAAYTQGSLAARLTPISVAQGNPVYIEVDYEARDAGLGNQFAAGGYVKETLFNRVTIGGGFLNERRGDGSRPDYRLYGGSIEVKPWDGIVLGGEINRSEGRDTDLAISADGGQSFADIRKPETDIDPADGGVTKPVTGYAMKATARFDLQKILKSSRELVTLSAYGARIDPNFYASNGTLEQGQAKFGVAARGAITNKDFVLARHDGVWSDLPVLDQPGFLNASARRVGRQLSAAGYEHVERSWDVGALYYHTYTKDETLSAGQTVGPSFHTDTINLRGSYKVTPKLTLFATQEFILQGDPSIITRVADRFATELGVRYKLTEQLEGFVSEIVRYSGSNATQIGLRSRFGEDGRIYVAERFRRDQGGFTTTTIVGGEDAVARGSRAYGEYQLDAGLYGPHARAVYGLNNRWELTRGLYVGLLYERSQNVGTATGLGTGTASAQGGIPTQTPSYLGQGSGLLARDRAFFNPSAILGLNFPVGIASRDAASVSLEWLRWKRVKLTGRFEVRFDNQDVRLGGADRLTLFGTAGVAAQLHRDLSFLGRLEIADARETAMNRRIGALMQLSLGVAYRPVHHDFLNVLAKYTRRAFTRPIDLGNGFEDETVDAWSLVPMFEIPYIRTQIVEKLAVKMQHLRLDDLAPQRNTTILLINRLNFHVLRWLDLGVEYRWRRSFAAQDAQGGFLGEVSVSPWEYVRLGVGYNFTHFSDDEMADERIDHKGFFIRAVAKY